MNEGSNLVIEGATSESFDPFVIVLSLCNCLHSLLAKCCFACYILMSIKPPKPVCTLNPAFAPDLSKSISWSLFVEHAARALTCEISNPLGRAEVDISHSGHGLSRPQVGKTNEHKKYMLQDLSHFWHTLHVDSKGFNPSLWMSISCCISLIKIV